MKYKTQLYSRYDNAVILIPSVVIMFGKGKWGIGFWWLTGFIEISVRNGKIRTCIWQSGNNGIQRRHLSEPETVGSSFREHMKTLSDFLYIGNVTTKNKYGRWVPAICEPFFGLRKQCSCGRAFWTYEGYRGHYALKHILGL